MDLDVGSKREKIERVRGKCTEIGKVGEKGVNHKLDYSYLSNYWLSEACTGIIRRIPVQLILSIPVARDITPNIAGILTLLLWEKF
jgi:hypothetical protein